jgi:arginine decarboxylase
MPGHKLAKGVPYELAQDVLKLDVTEVEGTDNLHYPEGIIKQAQDLAAEAFGADRTFFLVNGSTCGIQAAILSTCSRGQKIIIGRDSHKSVVAGLILSGAKPVYVYPEYNCEFGITGEITAYSIERALSENPDAAAVLITRPNYYGICSDIEAISKIVHSSGKILIVDEAHGAHLAFSLKLPPPALLYGADICIQSAHKTLPAVTQGAYLHVKHGRVDLDRLSFNLTMLQTSSPSYIIMSYLDIARELMEKEGGRKLELLLQNIGWFKNELKDYQGYRILSAGQHSNLCHDATRIVINTRNIGISGYEAEKVLRDKFKTQIEMADLENLVFITTIADRREDFLRLSETMKSLYATNFERRTAGGGHEEITGRRNGTISGWLAEVKKYTDCCEGMLPYEAYASEGESIPLDESSGRIAAATVTPYPPGVPVLYPGEIISRNHIVYIREILDAGGKVNGIDKNIIKIVK